MSLELAIQQNTDTMKELIAVWNKLAANATTLKGAVDAGKVDTLAAGGVELASIKKETAQAAAQKETTSTPKADAAASPQKETAAASSASEAGASSSGAAVDYDAVKVLVQKVVREKGRETAAAVLTGLGVEKAPELKPEQYADAVKQLTAALA